MFNPAWFFVFATIIAVPGILFSFKGMMDRIQSNLENNQLTNEIIQKEQTSFFIRVAIFEAIPILLIVLGFMQIGTLDEPTNIMIPLIIVLAVLIFALVGILAIRRDLIGYADVPLENKNILNTYIFIGIAMVAAIPIVCIVALFTMSS